MLLVTLSLHMHRVHCMSYTARTTTSGCRESQERFSSHNGSSFMHPTMQEMHVPLINASEVWRSFKRLIVGRKLVAAWGFYWVSPRK